MTRQLGQIACEAWTTSHLAHHEGCQITSWDDLADQDRDDWQRAALAVMAALPPHGWAEP